MPLTESSHKNLSNARGFMLTMLLLALVAAFHLMLASNKVKMTLQFPANAERVQEQLQRATFFCQTEELAFTRYLFYGDPAELEQLELAQRRLRQIDPHEDHSLKDLLKLEADWYADVAQPLIAQRRALDAGHGTLAQLEVRYLQVGGVAWEHRLSQSGVYTAPAPGAATFESLRQGLSNSLTVRIWVGLALCVAALLVAIVGLRCISRVEETLQDL